MFLTRTPEAGIVLDSSPATLLQVLIFDGCPLPILSLIWDALNCAVLLDTLIITTPFAHDLFRFLG